MPNRSVKCLLVALGVGLSAGAALAQDAPAIDVAAVAAAEIDWQEKISSIGIAEALQGVNVSGSEAGTVAEISVRFRQRGGGRSAPGAPRHQQGESGPRRDRGAAAGGEGGPRSQAQAGEGSRGRAKRPGRCAVQGRRTHRAVDLAEGDHRPPHHPCAVRRRSRHPQSQQRPRTCSRATRSSACRTFQ